MTAIEKIKKHLETLEFIYSQECANTQAPGNPYICSIKGQIAGLKQALLFLEGES